MGANPPDAFARDEIRPARLNRANLIQVVSRHFRHRGVRCLARSSPARLESENGLILSDETRDLAIHEKLDLPSPAASHEEKRSNTRRPTLNRDDEAGIRRRLLNPASVKELADARGCRIFKKPPRRNGDPKLGFQTRDQIHRKERMSAQTEKIAVGRNLFLAENIRHDRSDPRARRGARLLASGFR